MVCACCDVVGKPVRFVAQQPGRGFFQHAGFFGFFQGDLTVGSCSQDLQICRAQLPKNVIDAGIAGYRRMKQ